MFQFSAIYVHTSSSHGRIDHIMANMNALFLVRDMTDLPVFLIGAKSLAFLLPPVSMLNYLH